MKDLSRWLAIALLIQAVVAAAQTAPADPAAEPAIEPAVRTGTPRAPTMDRLELDPTTITGNRELPKVMVIVPWKRSDLGELQGRPANSLLNEVLSPVDRDVFRREMRYFDALDSQQSPEAAGEDGQETPPSTQPET